jgi:hypothetical protein
MIFLKQSSEPATPPHQARFSGDPGTFGRCPGSWFVGPLPIWTVGS